MQDLYFRQIIPALHGPATRPIACASVNQGGSGPPRNSSGIEATGHDIYLSVRSRS